MRDSNPEPLCVNTRSGNLSTKATSFRRFCALDGSELIDPLNRKFSNRSVQYVLTRIKNYWIQFSAKFPQIMTSQTKLLPQVLISEKSKFIFNKMIELL